MHTTLHGVFLKVFDLGLLLAGPSGIGKSELGLGLIARGHKLIADDAVDIKRLDKNHLQGSCPDLLKDFLEVRGLGPLNIAAMFGAEAILPSCSLDLIVYVNKLNDKELVDIDRLHGLYRQCKILDVEIPEVTIPISPGRDLVILVEAAARNHKLRCQGYFAGDVFSERQQQLIMDKST